MARVEEANGRRDPRDRAMGLVTRAVVDEEEEADTARRRALLPRSALLADMLPTI